VVTGRGRITCDKVVICAGQWSRELGRKAGVNIPLVSVQHQYLITEAIDGVASNLPTLRDPDRLTYWKEEVGGLVMGGYEPNPKPWAEGGIPDRFQFQLLEDDLEHFEPLLELAIGRVPAMQTAGIKQFINGPESFTPDGNFILGETPEVRGIFIGTGFNAFGIASGGGAGMALAEWVAKGVPPFDLWPVDIRRFGKNALDTNWVRTRTLEAYAKHYTMAWPFEEHRSGRPLRRSPLYDRLKAQGACFGEKLGWERPNWFADIARGETAEDRYSYERQNWFAAVGREHAAARERVAVFDQTSFAKFHLVGRDAERAVSWICANDVAKPVGHLVYTQMLNERGGIECDLTVGRLSETEYYIVTGTGFSTHDFDWISRSIPEGLEAHLFDITSSHAVLSVMGPRSRDLLQALTDSDMSNAAFPFGRLKRITLANAPMFALRVTYVGELGWELHIPVEFTLSVYDALMSAGERHGIANAGYRAIESLRLEKGYRAWGADIGPDHSPLVAGLGWAVKLKSNAPFQGREALEAQAKRKLPRLLGGFAADPSVVLLGRETIYRNGKRVGWLSSGGYGYTIGRSIGYGYVRDPENGVDRDSVLSGDYELEVATVRVPAQVFLDPIYDPTMSRVKS
jgi:sarcosine dehydrogenase